MEEIFLKWGTDKSTTHSYLEAYESLFSKRRNDELRILEIGIWAGASLLAWAEYFTNENTEIIGIDVSPQPFIAEVSKNPKIKTIIGDATNVQDIELIGGTFDFIIDDGSHRLGDQLRAFKILKNRLRDGGVYIIEDIQSVDDAKFIIDFANDNGFKVQFFDTREVKGRCDDLMVCIMK